MEGGGVVQCTLGQYKIISSPVLYILHTLYIIIVIM